MHHFPKDRNGGEKTSEGRYEARVENFVSNFATMGEGKTYRSFYLKWKRKGKQGIFYPYPPSPENVEGNAVMQSERLLSIARLMSRLSPADPGFLRGLDASPPGCANKQFRQIFQKTA